MKANAQDAANVVSFKKICPNWTCTPIVKDNQVIGLFYEGITAKGGIKRRVIVYKVNYGIEIET